MRIAADHGARRFRKGDDPCGPLERFEAARDLGLLLREVLGGEGLVRFGAQRIADAEKPAVEGRVPRAAIRAGVEMRVAAAGRPEARELLITEVTTSEAFKK